MVTPVSNRIRRFAWFSTAAAALLIAGCAATTLAQSTPKPAIASAPADPPLKTAEGDPAARAARNVPPPKVQNCAVVTISTPVKYACNGKVYTNYELQHLREKWEASNK